jgi:hypothetical protein
MAVLVKLLSQFGRGKFIFFFQVLSWLRHDNSTDRMVSVVEIFGFFFYFKKPKISITQQKCRRRSI